MYILPAARPLQLLLCIGILITVSCVSKSDSKDKASGNHDSLTNNHSTDTMSVPVVNEAEAILQPSFADTLVSGKAIFRWDAQNQKTVMLIDISIPLKAGKMVAAHIHEHGDCGNNGEMAHGHWNPGKKAHGKWGGASFHTGDIGNIQLDEKGKGSVSLETDLWTLGGAAEKNILGKAIIIHGGSDDYTSQPAGNAGTRIGCGVIQ